jgi:hypothetical protein
MVIKRLAYRSRAPVKLSESLRIQAIGAPWPHCARCLAHQIAGAIQELAELVTQLFLVRCVSNRPGGICRRSARRGGGCRALLLGGRPFLLQRLQFLRDRIIRSHCNTEKLNGFGQKALPRSSDIWKAARPSTLRGFRV